MSAHSSRWADGFVPGLGLMAEGVEKSWIIAALSLIGMACIVGAPAVAPDATAPWRIGGCGLLCAAHAVTWTWRWLRRARPVDAEGVMAAHRAAAAAYVRGEWAAAATHADAVCRLAPREPGAWRLRAMVATAAGDARAARTFTSYADRLENQS